MRLRCAAYQTPSCQPDSRARAPPTRSFDARLFRLIPLYHRCRRYRSGIYPHDEEQRQVAAAAVAALGPRCAVEVEPYTCFWPAEEYHQSYLQKMKSTCSGSLSACHI